MITCWSLKCIWCISLLLSEESSCEGGGGEGSKDVGRDDYSFAMKTQNMGTIREVRGGEGGTCILTHLSEMPIWTCSDVTFNLLAIFCLTERMLSLEWHWN